MFYEFNKKLILKLELINLKQEAGAVIEVEPVIPDKFRPDVLCVTVDSTIDRVDSLSITADQSCFFDGVIIESTREVIPLTVYPKN